MILNLRGMNFYSYLEGFFIRPPPPSIDLADQQTKVLDSPPYITE